MSGGAASCGPHGYATDEPRSLPLHAARFGLRVTHTWASSEVTDVRLRERELLSLLRSMGRRAPGGREYFLHIPFTLAKAQMENRFRPIS